MLLKIPTGYCPVALVLFFLALTGHKRNAKDFLGQNSYSLKV